jgi:hypothetical protein
MTPLSNALGRLSQEVGATLTAYDANGDPIATTAAYRPATIDTTTARTLVGGGAIVMRNLHGSEREALGRLIVDHQPDAVLGAALDDNSRVTGRAVILYVLIGLVCTLAITASLSLRLRIRRPR